MPAGSVGIAGVYSFGVLSPPLVLLSLWIRLSSPRLFPSASLLFLSPPVGLRNPFAQLVLLRDGKVVQVDIVQQPVFHDLTHDFLLDVGL